MIVRLALWVLLIPLTGLSDVSRDSDYAEYFPLRSGSMWTYRSNQGQKFVRTAEVASLNGLACCQINSPHGGLILAGMEVYRLDSRGLLLVGLKHSPLRLERPITLLKFPPRTGSKWEECLESKGHVKHEITLRFQIGGEETISVPAGTFKALRMNCEVVTVGPQMKSTMHTSWYFARRIGLAKFTAEHEGQPPHLVLELESAQLPK